MNKMHKIISCFGGHCFDQFCYFIFEIFRLQPSVFQNLLSRYPLGRILVQHLGNQILDPRMSINREFKIEEFAVSFLSFLFSVLWKIPQNKPIQQYPKSPNVSFEWIVILFINQFWAHILWGSCQFHFRMISHHRQSQIDQFNLIILIYQDVFCLQIPMRNLLIVQIGQSLCNLHYYFSQNLLIQRSMLTSII